MSEHDWPEDYKHENGNYIRKCQCGAEFVGHKRRFICKVCYLSHIEQQLAELREALEEIATSDHLGNRWAQSKARAALQEKGE